MTVPATQAPASTSVKRVLALSYSQTGQLDAVAASLLAPLREDPAFSVHIEVLRPQPAYPFPWPFFRFIDAFPESALLVPPKLGPLNLSGDEDFDLIVLPYQVWFLAPSPPITAFLKHPTAARLLKGKPVITVIACRNMWLMAQEKMKSLLSAVGARLIDNVVLTDAGSFSATFITTPLWLLTGKRDGWWGLPRAGVADNDIRRARRFGLALRDALARNAERKPAPLLSGLGAVAAQPRLLFSEKAATRSFFVWGKLIHALGAPGAPQRQPFVALYVVFLLTLIVTVIPISLLVQVLIRPLMRRRFSTLKTYFEQPSGSGTERMSQYDC